MLSIVIPSLNAATSLPGTLESLDNGLNGFEEYQIVISDGGSTDNTLEIGKSSGADILSSDRGRGMQLVTGANAATGDWLLFVHADTKLQSNWQEAVSKFMADQTGEAVGQAAAVFRFRLDEKTVGARILQAIVAWRTKWLALPYGDQCLLISRKHYDAIGGYRPLPIMEDVDIIRRIGRRHLVVLKCDAITSASRYKQDGYLPRVLRNLRCLSMWFLGVSPDKIAKVYR